MNFEQKIKELEKITEKLAGGDLSLEDAIKSFEKGVKLSTECSKELSQTEKKVQQLIKIDENSQPITKDFNGE